MNKYWILTSMLLLSSCVPIDKTIFLEFKSYLSSLSGRNSIDCGFVKYNRDLIETNTCVADSFVNGLSFYATYLESGIASISHRVGGLTFDNNLNTLYVMNYQRTVSAFFTLPGIVTTELKCVAPVYQGTVDTDFRSLFSCL